jgi:hypothetical protein
MLSSIRPKARVTIPLDAEAAYRKCMEVASRDIWAAPFAWRDHSRINVAVTMRPWRLGGVLHLRLRPVSLRETEVEISGFGLVRRDIERMAAVLTKD